MEIKIPDWTKLLKYFWGIGLFLKKTKKEKENIIRNKYKEILISPVPQMSILPQACKLGKNIYRSPKKWIRIKRLDKSVRTNIFFRFIPSSTIRYNLLRIYHSIFSRLYSFPMGLIAKPANAV